MENLKRIKESLVNEVLGQITNMECVDTHELGEVIDMIKDMAEAIYHCSIVKAMEERQEQEDMEKRSVNNTYYYTEKLYRPPYYDEWRDYDKDYGRMYYNPSTHDTQTWNRTEKEYGIPMRDAREGRSPMSRKSYMESKELHHDKATQMHELEKYMQELSQDVTEMIKDASPEEKQILQRKISALANKVESLNV